MESIYDPKLFKASEHMAVADYFKEYKKLCYFTETFNAAKDGSLYLSREQDTEIHLDKIRQEMNVHLTDSQMKELENVCCVNQLTLSDEPDNLPMEIPENLHTKSRLEHIYPTNTNARQLNVIMCLGVLENKSNIKSDVKFLSKRFIKTAIASNVSVMCDMAPGSNFIYTMLFYKPFLNKFAQRNIPSMLRYAFEIEALGTSTLAEVADKISCISNEGLFREVENTTVDLKPLMNAKEHYPSQCFYVDGVLYNDFRSPNAIDYTSKIIQWANDKNLGRFKTELMENTVLNTLTPRLGYPYVYIHHGNCEHIFSFSDARLLQPNDCLNSKKYPRVTTINRMYNILCFICGVANVQWIVLDCDRFPHEKIFLCTECCNSYLYVDGKKVTEFRLYPYYDQDMLTKHQSTVIVD